MNYVEEVEINCPYCGEFFSIIVECVLENQSYIEDCYICCRPIEIVTNLVEKGGILVEARRENG